MQGNDRQWRIAAFRTDLQSKQYQPVVNATGERVEACGPWRTASYLVLSRLEKDLGIRLAEVVGPGVRGWSYVEQPRSL